MATKLLVNCAAGTAQTVTLAPAEESQLALDRASARAAEADERRADAEKGRTRRVLLEEIDAAADVAALRAALRKLADTTL